MGQYEERLKTRVKQVHESLDDDRAAKAARLKKSKEYRMFVKLPDTGKQQMWCRQCRRDFVALSWKEWSFTYMSGSWFTRCPDCGAECARYISNKVNDPYYEESDNIREARGLFRADTLQPREYGFRTHYGRPFERWEQERIERDEEIRTKYAALGIKGTTIKEKTEREFMEEYFGEQ